jgi:hydrogenase nickel incorporation protein HypA/HybF
MHEVGIMQSVLDIAARQASDAGARSIEQVRMRVGRLTGVVVESLQHAFAVLKEGTMAQGATLVVDEVDGLCFCMDCAREFAAEGLFAECPDCGQPSFDIRRGRELDVVSLEVE